MSRSRRGMVWGCLAPACEYAREAAQQSALSVAQPVPTPEWERPVSLSRARRRCQEAVSGQALPSSTEGRRGRCDSAAAPVPGDSPSCRPERRRQLSGPTPTWIC